MTKTLLLSLALAAAASATAANPAADFTQPVAVTTVAPQQHAPRHEGAAAGSINYTLAGDPESVLGFNGVSAKYQIASAFEITAGVASDYAGNKITKINFYTGVRNNTQRNYVTNATVFLTHDLEGEPFMTQDVTLGTEGFAPVSVELTEPYTIEEDTPVYVGMYSVLKSANDFTIVVDGLDHGDAPEGAWAAYRANASQAFTWMTLVGTGYGNVCMSATIEGESLPTNIVNVSNVTMSPLVNANTPFNVDVTAVNMGANGVESFEIEYTAAGGEAVTIPVTLDTPLAFGETYTEHITATIDKVGSGLEFVATVTKVNGEANNSSSATGTFAFASLAEGDGYPRNIVIEEGTGTWCGWCPRGIVMMEYIRDTYTDGSFIPVAVHQGDPMEAASFAKVLNFFPGFPSAIINRTIDVNPGDPAVYSVYDQLRAIPALAMVESKCYFSDSTKTKLTFEAASYFTYDNDNNSNYRLSFVVTEDGVGPYSQSNYYAGGGNGECGGWESKGSRVSTIYDDVARQLDTFEGIEGSVPAQVVGGEKNAFTYEMTLPKTIKNKEKLNGIVYLIDTNTGEIVNACIVKSDEINSTTAISSVAVDNNAPVEYFNLQGIRVDNPTNGVFIRRQGNTVTKVAL